MFKSVFAALLHRIFLTNNRQLSCFCWGGGVMDPPVDGRREMEEDEEVEE